MKTIKNVSFSLTFLLSVGGVGGAISTTYKTGVNQVKYKAGVNQVKYKAGINQVKANSVYYGETPVFNDAKTEVTYGLYPQETQIQEHTTIYEDYLRNATDDDKNSVNGYYLFDNNYYDKIASKVWYKCDPIVWDVLEESEDDNYKLYTVMSKKVLDYKQYVTNVDGTRTIGGKTVEKNNYQYSLVRAWLNGLDAREYLNSNAYNYTDSSTFLSFKRKAFGLDPSYLNEMTVDNSPASTERASNSYACPNTNDKITIPSLRDANTTYPSLKTAVPSNYVKNVGSNWFYYTASYWTRSPGAPSDNFSEYDIFKIRTKSDGKNLVEHDATYNYCGIRPIIQIKVKKATSITLDRQGGTTGDTSVDGINGEAMPSATMPTRPGYTFNGYYSEKEGKGTKYYNADGTSTKNWDSEAESATLYASWTIKDAVTAVINAINAIEDPVVLTDTCKGHIDAARSAYDALDDFDKDAVTNYSTLTAAEARYDELVAAKAAADAVIAKINEIGTVTYPDSKSKIDSARSAYNALDEDGKSFVTNLSTLTDAESAYATLKDGAVNNVINLIDAIGEVTYPDSKDKILPASNAYLALPDEDKALVTNYSALETATSTYDTLAQEAINNVKDLINAIGTVTLDSKDKIDTARSAYNALDDSDKDAITNYSTLTDAEARYAELLTKKANADEVVDLIDAIGEVKYPDSKDKIEAARAAYDELIDAEEKGFVTNYDVLTAAEAKYDNLRNEAIDDVIDKIELIDEITLDTKDEIETARAAYNNLADGDKPSVTNYSDLELAEARYAELVAAKEKADKVVEKINAIGEVNYSDSLDAINDARTAYNALTNDDERYYVTNYSTLTDAEAEYDNLRNEAIDDAINKIELIDEITLDTKDEIETARAAYDNLADGDKPSVTNYSDLELAEARYAELVAAKEKADKVVEKINAIGEVNYSDSLDAINDARTAYNALTNDDERYYVTNYSTLTAAETEYNRQKESIINVIIELIDGIGEVKYPDSELDIEFCRELCDQILEKDLTLVTNYNTLTAAEAKYEELKQAGVKNVKDLINAIGTLEYNDACKNRIDAARTAYNALTDEQKELVTNYDTLTAAEAKYEELKQAGAKNVKDLINAIGTLEYSDACKNKIDAARTAYDALTNEQKALVDNLYTLTHKEEVYNRAKAVVDKINKIGEVGLDSGEAIKTSTENYESLTEEEKQLIAAQYNTLVNKNQTYDRLVESHRNGIITAIVLGSVGGFILLLVGIYFLMMFVFNKWIKKEDKAVRVIKLWKKKDGSRLLIALPIKFTSRNDEEIFKTKEEALK